MGELNLDNVSAFTSLITSVLWVAMSIGIITPYYIIILVLVIVNSIIGTYYISTLTTGEIKDLTNTSSLLRKLANYGGYIVILAFIFGQLVFSFLYFILLVSSLCVVFYLHPDLLKEIY